MPDVLDEIIDRLPPSTLKMVLDFNTDCVQRTENVNKLLNDMKRIKSSQLNKELERKIFDIKSKTAENRISLKKIRNELEVLKTLEEPSGNEQSIKAYAGKIHELEAQVKNLTKDSNNINLTELFSDIENLSKQIEEYKNKISEAKNKYQCYDNFPPNLEQAKKAIEDIKERIKQKESMVELFS